MTSGGNYPPDPYPGSYGYPPEGNDSEPPPSPPVASPAVARAAISLPGLRVEPPGDGQPGSSASGQVYGRPSPTTYGRPVSPAPVGDPERSARQAADDGDFAGPGQPRGYGQPQRPQPIEPDQPYDSDARRGAGAEPGQLADQHPDSWENERVDPPSWQQNVPSWQSDNERGPTAGPAERTPGLYGHAAARSPAAPQPLYGGAPSVPPPGAGSDGPVGQPGPADATSNGHSAGVPGVDGPSASAFGQGVYGAGIYGATTYGTPRDGGQDDSMPSRTGVDAAPGRNGFVDAGETGHGPARPAAPASSQDALGGHNRFDNDHGNNDHGNNDQVNGGRGNDDQVNGGRVGNAASGSPTPDSLPARSRGVYGTPRIYGSPRPTPTGDDSGDSPAGFDDRREPTRFDDRREPTRFDDRREPNHLTDRPGSVGDLPLRPFGDVPGRAVADLPPRPAAGDGIGRPADAMDRARFDDAMLPTALGRPVPAWLDPPRPEFNPPDAPTTSPSAMRLGQTYGSSRSPIDWNVPEQHSQASFDRPFAPGEGVRIPTGASSLHSPGSVGRGEGGDSGDGGGVAPAADIRPAPEPRRRTRKVGIVAIVVIVIGLAAGALYYTSRPNAPSYQIGACVQHSGEQVNGSACTAPNSFKIISKVSDASACPNAKDPYLYLGNDRSTVYCLRPN